MPVLKKIGDFLSRVLKKTPEEVDPYRLGPSQFQTPHSIVDDTEQETPTGIRQKHISVVNIHPMYRTGDDAVPHEKSFTSLSPDKGINVHESVPVILGCGHIVHDATAIKGSCDCHSLTACSDCLKMCTGCSRLICRRGANILSDFSNPDVPLPEPKWFCDRCYPKYSKYYTELLEWKTRQSD